MSLKIEVEDSPLATSAEMDTLSTVTLETANTFDNHDAVAIKRETIKAERTFNVVLLPHSVSVLTLRVMK